MANMTSMTKHTKYMNLISQISVIKAGRKEEQDLRGGVWRKGRRGKDK